MSNHDLALMAHLMRRAGFGAPREELEARAAKGYEATVEELLHPEEPPLDRNAMMRYHPWTWRPGSAAVTSGPISPLRGTDSPSSSPRTGLR
jgi:hypothetical protein